MGGSLRFGLYHSIIEWYNPLWLLDEETNTTRYYPEEKFIPELTELVMKYHPEVVWADGDGQSWRGVDYWGSLPFLSWLYSKSPVKETVVTNDRWGAGVRCKHGDFVTCKDRYNPGTLQGHKFENAMTIDKKSWGHRRNMLLEEILTMDELVETIVTTISCGGNILVNVGPASDGTIEPIFQERLRQMGYWLGVNGEGVYKTVPWTTQNDTVNANLWYTSKTTAEDGVLVYGHVLGWPQAGVVELGSVLPTDNTQVSVLGYSGGNLTWKKGAGNVTMVVQLPHRADVNSDWGFVLRMVGVKQSTSGV